MVPCSNMKSRRYMGLRVLIMSWQAAPQIILSALLTIFLELFKRMRLRMHLWEVRNLEEWGGIQAGTAAPFIRQACSGPSIIFRPA